MMREIYHLIRGSRMTQGSICFKLWRRISISLSLWLKCYNPSCHNRYIFRPQKSKKSASIHLWDYLRVAQMMREIYCLIRGSQMTWDSICFKLWPRISISLSLWLKFYNPSCNNKNIFRPQISKKSASIHLWDYLRVAQMMREIHHLIRGSQMTWDSICFKLWRRISISLSCLLKTYDPSGN